jgi:hypothetical protein
MMRGTGSSDLSRMLIKAALAVAVFTTLAALAPRAAFASTITVGLGGGIPENNCVPFSCPSLGPFTSDQQTYSAGAFSGPITINNFAIYDNVDPGTLAGATYDISFSTTPTAVDGGEPSSGTEQLFGNYTFTGQEVDGTLVFSGVPFYYNPLDGNLLMTIAISNITGNGGASFESTFGYNMSRYAAPNGGNYYEGIITSFDVPVSTPEPSTSMLTLLGSSLLALLAFRRLAQNVA